MEYLNFDVEIAHQGEGSYPVGVRSEVGEARQRMRLPLQEQALENVLLRLQNALLRSASLHRGVLSPEEQLVQDFGRTLFESLLAGDLRRLYDASLARATQLGKRLRLRLNILAPELATLPWEFLYDPLQQEFVCLRPDTVIVRYLESALPTPPFKVALPLYVLAMIASPSDQALLDIAREKQRLVDALHPLEQRGLVKLRWVEGQTVQALHQALLQRDWHIFHFIGHGGMDPRLQEGVLALANERGMTHLLSATDLGRLLALHHPLRLVVLNACQGALGNKRDLFSSTAATLASKGIPAVLAMQYDISDQAAIEFTRGFYGALAAGISVDGAVTHARAAISVGARKSLEWVTPVLYLRSPSGLLFDIPKSANGSGIIQPLGIGAAPPAPTVGPPQPPILLPRGPQRLVSRRAVLIGAWLVGMAAAGGLVALPLLDHKSPAGSSTPSTSGSSSSPSVTGGASLPFTYRGHTATVYALSWSPHAIGESSASSYRVASASDDRTVQVWDALAGLNPFVYSGHMASVDAVMWSPDGTLIASGGPDVEVWNPATRARVSAYTGDNGIEGLVWSLDGKRIASASNDKTVRVWDALTGGNVSTYTGHSDWVLAVAWSPNGRFIASASRDKTVQVWDAVTLKTVYIYRGHNASVNTVAWSPDSRRVVSGSSDKTVQVWDASTGGNVVTYQGHSNVVEGIAWSPDGQRIASASRDTTVQVWDAAVAAHLFTYTGHFDAVWAVAWSPDNKYIASGGIDRTVQVWQPQ
jgi:hypothetical protein